MRKIMLAVLGYVLLVCGGMTPSMAGAQQVRQTTRTGTAFGDSSLFFTSDTLTSKTTFVTRAVSLAQWRKGLSKFAFDSLKATTFSLSGATMTGVPTWSSGQIFPSVTSNGTIASNNSAAGAASNYTAQHATGGSQTNFDITANIASGITLTTTGVSGGSSNFIITSGGTFGVAATSSAITSSNANALAVGRLGLTTPAFLVDASTGSSVTGFKIKAGALAGGVALSAISSGTDESVTFDAKGAGNITFSGTSTGSNIFNTRVHTTDGTAARPAYAFMSDTTTGMYTPAVGGVNFATAGALSMKISGGATPTWQGGAGNLTITSGSGNNRSMTLQTTNNTAVVANTLVLGADSSVTAVGRIYGPNGTVTLPTYSFTNSTGTGIYRFGVDTLGISIAGAASMTFPSAGKMLGIAGNMTVTAGTGNSRTMTLQSTTSAGTAKSNVVLNADSSTTFLGAINPNQTLGLTGTTTNNSAVAGAIGEYISGSRATGSSLSLSTGTPLTVDSISLTAGDWDVSGSVAYTAAATTSITDLTGGINTTTNVLGALGSNYNWETAANVITATADPVWTTPTVRVSLSGTAFVYLVAQGTFTVSTLKGYGAMRARRVR